MFPLSYARVRTHTGREINAYKKTCFFTYFANVVLNIDEVSK